MYEIKKEFLEDICYDFNEDNGKILAYLEESKIQWLRDRIEVRIAEFITSLSQ